MIQNTDLENNGQSVQSGDDGQTTGNDSNNDQNEEHADTGQETGTDQNDPDQGESANEVENDSDNSKNEGSNFAILNVISLIT